MIWIIIILVTLFIFSACVLGNEHDNLDAINEREYINHIKEEKEKRGKNE